ncbi:putative PTH11-type G-protein coupled receptor protein [Echria macrotheca]|uniref:PTH11-type G-protein coupled receptor protein n=1 Tax=Echria macrotheca TaxID=438768 RepID=A0AAJ0F9R3_9PEZI|nr:putative PTH11-type G-protein coupled receptor protein [Echria macrotheca]
MASSESLPVESRASQVQAACIAFFVVSPIFVALRIWGRVKVRSWSGLSWDDATLFVAWIFSVILGALVMGAAASGLGRHISDLELGDVSTTIKLTYVADIFYKLSLNMTKISILLLYVRRFVAPWFTASCRVMLGLMAAFLVATTITTIVQCTPVNALWDPTVAGTCIDGKAFWYFNGGFTILTDVILLALPFQPIHASGLPAGQKIALILVFAFGMFTTVTSILRMQSFDTGADFTFHTDTAIWSVIEANLAIICGCVPVFRPLLAPIFPKQFEQSTIKPADNRRHTLAVCRSETSLARSITAKKLAGIRHSKAVDSTTDLEKMKFEDLPPPPFIRDPNGPPRRSSMLRDAYVWLSTVV